MSNDKQSNLVIKIIIAIGVIILIASVYMLISIEIPIKPLAGEGGSIEVTNGNSIGGDFELVDQNGNIFNSVDLKGKLSLVYFGFTYCPDICPTSLYKLTEVLNILDKYRIDVVPIFITIDPERDSSSLLKEYLKHFHPKFIGLTGDLSQIRDVADKFKVYYAKSANDNGSEDYMIDHSSFIYLLDKQGKYLKHFYFNSKAEEIIEFVRLNR